MNLNDIYRIFKIRQLDDEIGPGERLGAGQVERTFSFDIEADRWSVAYLIGSDIDLWADDEMCFPSPYQTSTQVGSDYELRKAISAHLESSGFELITDNPVPGTSGLPSLWRLASEGYSILTF